MPSWGVVGLLQDADADEHLQFYQGLGLNLAYQRVGGKEKVAASLAVEFLRVGGGTCNFAPRHVVMESPWSELRRAA